MSDTTWRKKPRLEVQTDSEMAANSAPSAISPRMLSRLHTDQMPSLAFLEAPLERVSEGDYNGYFSDDRKTFGVQHEAFKRDAYEHLGYVINEKWVGCPSSVPSYLAIVSGSSGVGKSVFLAYFLARLRFSGTKNFALFHAPKEAKNRDGSVNQNAVLCSIWIDGQKVVHGTYQLVQRLMEEKLKDVEVVIMDGCVMQFSLKYYGFRGLIVLSAPPSQYIQGMMAAYPSKQHQRYYMPPPSYDEAIEMAGELGVEEDIVEENYQYMNGIARYLFGSGQAKKAVDDNVNKVDARGIIKTVTLQSDSKELNMVAVHALLLWEVKQEVKQEEGEENSPTFEERFQNFTRQPTYKMVSKYAERLVAKMLAKSKMEDLRDALSTFCAVDATKAYEGALVEAYAIRTFQNGDNFKILQLGGNDSFDLRIDPLEDGQIKMIEGAKLTADLVPYDSLPYQSEEGQRKVKPLLLWPTIPNFPTFDCFYHDGDRTVYCLQMTIAEEHDLKNSGAKMAKEYFDGLHRHCGQKAPEKYKAVFVVPNYSNLSKPQLFKAAGKNPVADQSSHFEQWKIVLPK